MSFNTFKCEIILFKNNNSNSQYTLGGTTLAHVQKVAYLGVTIQSTLKFDSRIAKKVQRSSKVRGLLVLYIGVVWSLPTGGTNKWFGVMYLSSIVW